MDQLLNLIPSAPYTKSIALSLPGDEEQTERGQLRWMRPIVLVGLYFSVIEASDDSLATPTLDDLLVSLGANESEQYTANVRSDALDLGDSEWADASALHWARAGRAMALALDGPSELFLSFRWKRPSVDSPIYNAALITVSAAYRVAEVAK